MIERVGNDVDVQCLRARLLDGAWWRQRPEKDRCPSDTLMQAIHTSMVITAGVIYALVNGKQSVYAVGGAIVTNCRHQPAGITCPT